MAQTRQEIELPTKLPRLRRRRLLQGEGDVAPGGVPNLDHPPLPTGAEVAHDSEAAFHPATLWDCARCVKSLYIDTARVSGNTSGGCAYLRGHTTNRKVDMGSAALHPLPGSAPDAAEDTA